MQLRKPPAPPPSAPAAPARGAPAAPAVSNGDMIETLKVSGPHAGEGSDAARDRRAAGLDNLTHLTDIMRQMGGESSAGDVTSEADTSPGAEGMVEGLFGPGPQIAKSGADAAGEAARSGADHARSGRGSASKKSVKANEAYRHAWEPGNADRRVVSTVGDTVSNAEGALNDRADEVGQTEAGTAAETEAEAARAAAEAAAQQAAEEKARVDEEARRAKEDADRRADDEARRASDAAQNTGEGVVGMAKGLLGG